MISTQKNSLYFIFMTIVLDMLGVGLIIPVLPDVIRRFTNDPESVNHLFGYFVSLYALMQFVASPILGSLSDQYGRRVVLLSSLLGASIDYIFMALATSLPFLFMGRIISGLTGASMTVANSYIADISDDSNRSANFGLIGAAFGIGFIAGPSLGGLLGHVSPMAPFFAAAFLNFVNFLFGIFFLPESLLPENRRVINYKKLNPLTTLSQLFSHKNLIYFVLIYGLLFLAGHVHPSIWTLYTEYKFGWSSFQVGVSLSFVGLIYGFSQAVLTKKLVPLWGENKALKVAIIFNAMGFFLYAIAPQGWMMYTIMLLTCISGLAMPCLQSMMTKQIDPKHQGELQGGLVSLSSLASIFSPIIFTGAFNWAVNNKSSFSMIGLPYFIATLFVMISWVLYQFKLKMILK